uniref:Uncharacterized protein n=1 Tax=Seriola dumerili TaxID=41447 RepID=A0A3B4VIB5_SERDU
PPSAPINELVKAAMLKLSQTTRPKGDPGSLSDDLDNLSSSHSRVRTESKSERLQGKLTPGPQTVILGDCAVKDLRSIILHIMAAHPNVKNLILHIGTNDVVKQQSEVLKQVFIDLLYTVSSLNAEVVERFSRLLALNTWLLVACTIHLLHFIHNFNFFWDRRYLFKADGLFLTIEFLLSSYISKYLQAT